MLEEIKIKQGMGDSGSITHSLLEFTEVKFALENMWPAGPGEGENVSDGVSVKVSVRTCICACVSARVCVCVCQIVHRSLQGRRCGFS